MAHSAQEEPGKQDDTDRSAKGAPGTDDQWLRALFADCLRSGLRERSGTHDLENAAQEVEQEAAGGWSNDLGPETDLDEKLRGVLRRFIVQRLDELIMQQESALETLEWIRIAFAEIEICEANETLLRSCFNELTAHDTKQVGETIRLLARAARCAGHNELADMLLCGAGKAIDQ
jgi:hypothetical protein